MADMTSLIKELRQRTSAKIIDCQKALKATEGDLEAAIDWLRKEGKAAATKKADRDTNDGIICISQNDSDKFKAIIDLRCETDFVARNGDFQKLANIISNSAVENKSLDIATLKNTSIDENVTIEDKIKESIAIFGENITLAKLDHIEVSNGIVASYVHNAVSSNMGRIAVLVGIESNAEVEALKMLGKHLAMHIAAFKPLSLSIDDISPDLVQKEKEILTEQARSSGKSNSVIEKMIEGRIRKYFEDVVLLEQTFVMDNKTKISTVLENFAKENNSSVKISKFVRFEVGAK